jgi:hypothetical protein
LLPRRKPILLDSIHSVKYFVMQSILAIWGECEKGIHSFACRRWNFIRDSISALQPAVDLPSRPDIRHVEDLRIDREDNSIVAQPAVPLR